MAGRFGIPTATRGWQREDAAPVRGRLMQRKPKPWQYSLATLLAIVSGIAMLLGIARLLPWETWLLILVITVAYGIGLAFCAPILALVYVLVSTWLGHVAGWRRSKAQSVARPTETEDPPKSPEC
jgi:MFS family permease